MRISMMRPIPFCPSLEPCAKLTPVQVKMRRPRIHQGGGALPSGALKRRGDASTDLAARSSKAASTKPVSGENSSERPMPAAWLQSTPLVPLVPPISWFIKPTPMMEPMSVCEDEDGRPKYQVPTFQMMAAIKSANTMAKPALEPTCRINSTGNSDTMPKATAPEEA